jgi:DNA-binding NtrC family response regulator
MGSDMARVLLAWIGLADLRAAESAGEGEANEASGAVSGVGPIASAAAALAVDELVVLSSHPPERGERYRTWLAARVAARVQLRAAPLSGPTDLGEIYQAAVQALEAVRAQHGRAAPSLVFHLSAGTPAMAAAWIILAKTRFPAELVESSRGHGVRTVPVPFDLHAEFLPDLLRGPDADLEAASAGLVPDAPELTALVHQSPPMRRLVARARRVALRSVPVLIEGESGTGKELLARALHHGGPRRAAPFVAVNCGALPEALVEAELFGHEKGAFTGAVAARPGHFRAAHGGTLFLDEIGELPAPAQVKLLRALQEGEVTPVGSSRALPVDVRVLAATHRNLQADVAAGRFRADLFYRLAVAILRVPPLRERQGDLGVLVDRLLEQVNRESAGDPGYRPRRLTPAARRRLHAHHWPGNVRELLNTLRRAALWSASTSLDADDIGDALMSEPAPAGATASAGAAPDLPLDDDFELEATLAGIARHYLERALAQAGGNRTRAAALLGLASRQTLSNWARRYGVE